ncbi:MULTISPECIES: hybrid sensor histidine kinase/response regulator [unclassified Oceanispirochaeta]|uniref:hybrid sensor histidine kinase/response regulator n=1 Tax=unclassified Oceanispirochaeta TaxID=2635722 RepID=UPI000E09D958|nr:MULTISPECIES: hybrid sensor histidine kinase/response regulator [unclassified Oceanispirochaeta]MBF9014674.1 hybrid sensor histidine kinase/response regulator [Oceanispirochaeta sp. M2]NPD70930.1 hybrid sensor histidine kinase/response regulator [Oceanispirochaeta sp. M1]RDG33764.1 hybrid sensor histidine kinase/response regulator [Oceanispirochaeta sp. M1]
MDIFSKAEILAVDDTPMNLDIILETLDDDYEISISSDGKEALEVLETIIPDLILLDIMMPGMDGFEVCSILKKDERLKDIPVIFLTALNSTEDVVKGLSLGAVDYIYKPFNPEELRSRVRTHIELKRSREEIVRQNFEQKELLHVLCHDLANPFTSILGVLSILEDDLPDELDYYFKLLQSAANNGTEVINLVRQMRQASEKGIDLESLNLKEMLEESISMLRQRITDKKLDVEINVDQSLQVQAEKTSLINSVLNNLMTNAVKFSYSHEKIRIDAEEKGDGIVLSIRDYGMGMPEEIRENMFDISKNISRNGTDGEKGTGFGMPTVKKFMELYGGSLEVSSLDEKSSPRDHGSSMILTFSK